MKRQNLVKRYLAGQGAYELARSYGIGKSTVYRILADAGVDFGDAPHHVARRDSTASFEELCRRAATRELNVTQDSPLEARVLQMLIDRGVLDAVPQKAIGPYNVDLAVDPLAIEVWGGGWHGGGAHLQRFQERTRYVLDSGWWQICVWCIGPYPLAEAAADEVVAYLEVARAHPPTRGQHRVIWGNGQPVRSHRFDLDERPLVAPD